MKYYIVTELERKPTAYASVEEAVEAAEQTLPRTMNWEIREDDEDVVYTHYMTHGIATE